MPALAVILLLFLEVKLSALVAKMVSPSFTLHLELLEFVSILSTNVLLSPSADAQPASMDTNLSTTSASRNQKTVIESINKVPVPIAISDILPILKEIAFEQIPTPVQLVKSHPTGPVFQSK